MKTFSILLILLITLYFVPIFTHAASLIPCTNTPDASGVVKDPCDFNALLVLFSNVINFVVKDLALPLATITIIYSGFTYLTTAISDKKAKARQMLLNVVIGFAVILAAWLIVNTIVKTLVDPSIDIPLQF